MTIAAKTPKKEKEIGSMSKTRTLHMHHRFYSILCCQGTTTKSILRFMEDVQPRQRLFFPVFEPAAYSPLECKFRNTPQHLTNQTRWNNSDEVRNSANSLLRWRFLCRRRRGYLSSLKVILHVTIYKRRFLASMVEQCCNNSKQCRTMLQALMQSSRVTS